MGVRRVQDYARCGSVTIHDGNPQDLVRVVHVHDEIVLSIRLDVVILNVEQEIELALDKSSRVCKELRIADRRAAGTLPSAGWQKPGAAADLPVTIACGASDGQAVGKDTVMMACSLNPPPFS